MIEQNLNQPILDTETLKRLKDQRDYEIFKVFEQTRSIAITRKRFNNAYSRDVIRLAIMKNGIWHTTARYYEQVKNAKNRVPKKKYINRAYSKQFQLEIELQMAIKKLFRKNKIYYKAEVQIPGSQMRADFKGKNWVIETKVNTTSQSMLTGISQCLIYANKLKKQHKILVLPDDIEATEFFKIEYINNNIKIICFSDLLNWVKEINV